MEQSDLKSLICAAIDPRHFEIRPPLQLTWQEIPKELIFWELFQGRVLDETSTRQRAEFHAWNIYVQTNDGPAPEPIISIKWEKSTRRLHITRSILCYAHRAVTSSANVVETKETQRWIRELVGSIETEGLSVDELGQELQVLMAKSVYGTGRLPLTSLETPLPQFLLGQLAYCPTAQNLESRRLEFALRCSGTKDAVGSVAQLREVFRGVSLSPYTAFVSNVIEHLRESQQRGSITTFQQLEFLSWLLRLQWRHLNAYDLFMFHHRGANYPDALLIEEVLRELLTIASAASGLCLAANARQIRRGLRLAWFVKLIYQNHLAPAQPTSPGENLRVMPAPFDKIPEEHIFQLHQRPRKLFEKSIHLSDEAESVLLKSFADLIEPSEVLELGTALILDRPLGIGKGFGEPDATPMLSHIAQSRKLALRNLAMLQEKTDDRLKPFLGKQLEDRLNDWRPRGPKISRLNRKPRPGVVSIQDAWQSTDDFHIMQTTAISVREFVDGFDWTPLGEATADLSRWHIIVPVPAASGEELQVFDASGTNWMTMEADVDGGYIGRRGIEWTRNGLRILAIHQQPSKIVVRPSAFR